MENVLIEGQGTTPTIVSCKIHGGRGYGDGIRIQSGACGTIEGCEIFDNESAMYISGQGTTPTVSACKVPRAQNIHVHSGADPLVDKCSCNVIRHRSSAEKDEGKKEDGGPAKGAVEVNPAASAAAVKPEVKPAASAAAVKPECTFKIVISGTLVELGRTRYPSFDYLQETELSDEDRTPDAMEDSFTGMQLDNAKITVFDENENIVFKADLDPDDESGPITFDGDYELFDEAEFPDGDEAYLLIQRKFTKERMAYVKAAKFNAGSLQINYSEFDNTPNDPFRVVCGLLYDGQCLTEASNFESDDSATEQTSWVELADSYVGFDVWGDGDEEDEDGDEEDEDGDEEDEDGEDEDEDGDEEDEDGDEEEEDEEEGEEEEAEEEEEGEEEEGGAGDPWEAIDEACRNMACDGIFFPESEKFQKKWTNIAGVIRDKLQKGVEYANAIAIIDCTIFGSAKNGVLLDRTGIYMVNDWTASEYNGFATWDQFASKGKVVTIEDDTVRILDKPKVGISMAGSDLDAKQAVSLFKQIQKIVKGG